ncbi:MAG: uncharacterized membrane protein (UPF0127 family) [Kiritimatiellia bacterium]|jgi:uncharacterized protein
MMRIEFEDGEVIADRVVEAKTFAERSKGLLGRSSLEPGEGMYFAHCSSIHMWFMRMAIDVIFLDADYRVTRICRKLPPWAMAAGGLRTKHTLELPSGSLPESRPAKGERLVIAEQEVIGERLEG